MSFLTLKTKIISPKKEENPPIPNKHQEKHCFLKTHLKQTNQENAQPSSKYLNLIIVTVIH